MLKSGQLLPKPMRPQGGTGPLRMAQVKQLESPKNADTGLDPIAEARKRALTRLAEVLFELSDGSGQTADSESRDAGHRPRHRGVKPDPEQPRRDPAAYQPGHRRPDFKGPARPRLRRNWKKRSQPASRTLPSTSTSAFCAPGASGWKAACATCRTRSNTPEYTLGAHLLMAQIHRQMEHLPEAVTEYMEALKDGRCAGCSPRTG